MSKGVIISRMEMFLKDLISKYDRHPYGLDGADPYSLACEFMNLSHHVYKHGSWLWRVVERQMEKLKNRTVVFDDLFPCKEPRDDVD